MAVRKAAQQRQSAATLKQTATSATHLSRGAVDAPGKNHRKPPPQEPIDKRMGEPREASKMGQKSVKTWPAAGAPSTGQLAFVSVERGGS